MTNDQALQALRDWVVTAAGLADDHVIIARPNAPRPSMPYATLVFTATSSIGVDGRDIGPVSGGGASIVITGHRRTTAQVQFFGGANEAASDYCEALRTAQSKPVPQTQAVKAGIAVADVGPTVDLSALVDTGYETRAAVAVTIGHAHEIMLTGDAAGGTIEHVVAEGVLDPGDTAVTVTADHP